MGKASSAKKVARAARAGGPTAGTRKNIAFPAALVLIVVLGVGLVVVARGTNPGDGEPQLGDHWHAAYGIYVCDRWVAPVSDKGPDTLGIHTHEDGLIHIHPFLAGATGDSATLGKFFDQTGIEVTDSSITLPPGEPYDARKYVNGETTCDGKQARVVAAYWADAKTAEGTEPTAVRTSDIPSEHFENDGGAYTIAFLPEDADIPAPLTASQIQELGAKDGGQGAPIQGAPEQNELPEGEGVPVDPAAPGAGGAPVPIDPAAPGAGGAPVPPDPGAGAPPAVPGADAPPATDAPGETEAPAGG